MAEENGGGRFWTSLPGVLTGLAALATAFVSAYAVIRGPSNGSEPSGPPPASSPASAPSLVATPGPGAASPTQAMAPSETSPGCRPGYVWRRARPGDRACVTPARSDAVAEENALAIDRRAPEGGPYGANTCLAGFVWRVAVADDYVCVTPESRDEAERDNFLAGERSE